MNSYLPIATGILIGLPVSASLELSPVGIVSLVAGLCCFCALIGAH